MCPAAAPVVAPDAACEGIAGGFMSTAEPLRREVIMPAPRTRQLLDESKVKYATINHLPAFTARACARVTHVPADAFAKSVVVEIDGRWAMVLEPATTRLSLAQLKKVTGASRVSLATEKECRELFPDCEEGAIPPFGHLYGMDVYMSESLTHGRQLVFNAGSHSELISLAYGDFAALEHPKVVPV
jgi:Ala-tRNA(Pro) deacylase